MSEVQGSLNVTLARLDAWIAQQEGRGREDIPDLNVDELAMRTALDPAEVSILLGGGEVPEGEVDPRVCQRVNAMYEAHLERTEHRPADVCAKVAAKLEITPKWARALLLGKRTPNVKHLVGLQKFFDVEEGFFTATAEDSLNRALQPVLRKLEAEEPLASLMDEFGLVAVHRRGGPLTPERKALLTSMLRAVLDSGADE
ncbi:hypothetical protein ACFVYG_20375 [Streptomyces sp. NPDC058256]|uniref:hypothetical protein n=1 Tax=Streptomyces sp. NPDC058256 TaxID=3346408 RepID=UPI0036ECD454